MEQAVKKCNKDKDGQWLDDVDILSPEVSMNEKHKYRSQERKKSQTSVTKGGGRNSTAAAINSSLIGADTDDYSTGSNLDDSSYSTNRSSSNFGDSENRTTSSGRETGGVLGDAERKKGDKMISASRCIFFSVLMVAAAVLASVAFLLYREEETQNFHRSFVNQAEELILYTNHNVDTAFATLRGISTSTTSLVKRTAALTGNPPGFIELPDIQYHLGLARNTTSALAIAYMPRVQNQDYAKWIEFTEVHKRWISLDQPGGPKLVEPVITPYIWEYIDDPDFGKNESLELILNVSQEYDSQLEQASKDTSNEATIPTTTGDERALRGSTTRTVRTASIAADGAGTSRKLNTADCTGDYFRRRDRERKLQELEAMPDHESDLEHAQHIDDKIELIKQEVENNADIPQVKVPSSLDAPFWAPVWQLVPVPIINETHPTVDVINYNLLDRPVFDKAVDYMASTRLPVFLDVCDQSAWFGIAGNEKILQTVVAFPVFEDFMPDSEIVAFFTAIIPWVEFFENQSTHRSNQDGDNQTISIVMSNTCDEIFTIEISGTNVSVVGEEDMHDHTYNYLAQEASFAPEYNRDDVEDYDGEVCVYTMTIYPTTAYESAYRTNRPALICMMILLVFLFTSLAFMLFDCLVTRRQAKLLNTALRQNAIVNSLFPKSVQKKLMEEAAVKQSAPSTSRYKRNIKTFLSDDEEGKAIALDSKPIADLFPKTTIMFADIAGFTAWSSAREPEAVFTLLETIYRAFDGIAKRRRVFKVEVVGDCYVAVCGLPDPNKDHHSVMCRFAQDCLTTMQRLVKELEVRLGPDTGDLMLRVGLHSGPVVAGVLRGEKSRFQLFGDTMNTASRMESTGVPNRIQISQATADLLVESKKEHWMIKREDKVKAKGKGELTTYFLLLKKNSSEASNGITASSRDEVELVTKSGQANGLKVNVKRTLKRNRVADWVVEMLGKLLKEMAAKRELTGVRPDSKATMVEVENRACGPTESMELSNSTVIDEVVDVLKLPTYAANGAQNISSSKSIPALDPEVMDELRDYVYSIADMYRKNPFHNFEHASHVSMSCIKLLNRIAARDEGFEDGVDHTYGICSDPLTSFAIVFSALIHDVDHTGAPNVQLVKEHAPVAAMYKNKSVAEQNSIDVGWGLLMEPTYSNLRRHIYTTVNEFKCFRQLVVNCVMATDIIDKDLIKARNKRWEEAFSNENDSGVLESIRSTNNRKATVVIEHLIQLSDISHTMQHWHIYRRWNERLFEECYVAYANCRAENNPSDNWYQGELGFYDFYIIPLAKKIKQCQVFGVASDEYLSYALQNRQEWEDRGKEVVEEMSKKMEATYNAGLNRQLMELEMGVEISAQSQISGGHVVKK